MKKMQREKAEKVLKYVAQLLSESRHFEPFVHLEVERWSSGGYTGSKIKLMKEDGYVVATGPEEIAEKLTRE